MIGEAVGLKTVTRAVINPPMSPTNMKGMGTELFQTKAAAASRMRRERPVLLTVPCRVMAPSPCARVMPRNVLSLRAGLPVLNIDVTSKHPL